LHREVINKVIRENPEIEKGMKLPHGEVVGKAVAETLGMSSTPIC